MGSSAYMGSIHTVQNGHRATVLLEVSQPTYLIRWKSRRRATLVTAPQTGHDNTVADESLEVVDRWLRSCCLLSIMGDNSKGKASGDQVMTRREKQQRSVVSPQPEHWLDEWASSQSEDWLDKWVELLQSNRRLDPQAAQCSKAALLRSMSRIASLASAALHSSFIDTCRSPDRVVGENDLTNWAWK